MEATTGSNRPDLARPASNRRIAYATIAVALFLAPRAFDGSEAGGLLAAILLAGILVLMRVLHIIHRMKGGTKWRDAIQPLTLTLGNYNLASDS